jgi:hypothetical protein
MRLTRILTHFRKSTLCGHYVGRWYAHEGVVPVTQTLSLVKADVLKVVMRQGYFGSASDWCSPPASQTDQRLEPPYGIEP